MEAKRRGSEGWGPEFKWQEVTPRPAVAWKRIFLWEGGASREEAKRWCVFHTRIPAVRELPRRMRTCGSDSGRKQGHLWGRKSLCPVAISF